MEQKTVHPADIKASLEKCGNRLVKVARDQGVSKGTVSRVITGKDKSQRIAKAIAEALNTSVEELWPGKYQARTKVPKTSQRRRARKAA